MLSNAYKYSPAGGAVRISLFSAEAAAGSGLPAQVGIRVTDHGLGMTPEQVAHVCDRFYRADSSGNIPGTGLGMSIVKEILELHGGQLLIESTIGVGTSVTLLLTLAMAS